MLPLLLAFVLSMGVQQDSDPPRAGVATVDLTPAGPIRLSGYGSRRAEATETAQRIFAKALALDLGDGPAVLIQVETCAVPAAFSEAVAARVAEATGIARARIALAATHTHSAPMLSGSIPNLFSEPIPTGHQERIDAYTARAATRLVDVATRAVADLRPAELAFAQGKVTFAANRRTAGGSVDHDLPVLKVTGADGGLRALLCGYACHCTTLGGAFNQVCGDWAGFAREKLELAHEGVAAIVTIGCGADANPTPRGHIGLARQYGHAIADEVDRLLSGPWTPVRGPMTAALDVIPLAFDVLPTRAELEERLLQGGAVGYHARVQLERLDRGEALRQELRYPVQTWRLGDDLAMVFLGGEVVVDYALRLKRELDPTRLWITAYANDVACYIPSERVLAEGGYEGEGAMVYYDQPTRFAPGLEGAIVATVRAQVGGDFAPYGGVDPSRTEGIAPRAPAAARSTIRVASPLRVELAAAEPLVEDPVAIDFGADGRVWVCEMRDYPSGSAQRGRVKWLVDDDGDGRLDEGTVFLDDLAFPTGVKVWRDGVLVCAAPDVIFAADRDGDGVADERRVVLRGFATHNEQARVNGLEWGLDNLVHGAGGLFGGIVEGVAGGRVDLQNRDFVLDPDRGVVQPAAGRAQQGRPRDDFGAWFGCDNSNPLFHYPLDDRDVRRNPHFAPPPQAVDVAAGSESRRVFPISIGPPRYNRPEDVGRITSACGLAIFRDELGTVVARGDAIVCEPVSNVVHRLRLEERGVTFVAHRVEDEAARELVASTDPWFRPVQVRTGPDGALWVVDMYRFLIEHPRFVPAGRLARIDPRAGEGMGRIWRIVATDGATSGLPALEDAPTAALLTAMRSPNGALRDLAHQVIVWRGGHEPVVELEAIAVGDPAPMSRVQALCALDGLEALRDEVLGTALADADARVRARAVRQARPRLPVSEALALRVLARALDESPAVRLQVACALGDWDDTRAASALARMLERDAGDPWIVGAVLSSATPHAVRMLAVLDDRGAQTALLGTAVAGARDAGAIAEEICRARDDERPAARFDAVAALLDACARVGTPPGEAAERAVGDARRVAFDDAAPLGDRIAALGLVGRAARAADIAAGAQLLVASTDPALQRAAVAALARSGDSSVPAALLDDWARRSPSVRTLALTALCERPAWAIALLERAASDRSLRASLGPTERQMLTDHADPGVRTRARALLTAPSSPREDVVARYRPAAGLAGDPERGRSCFLRVCAVCHQLDGVGLEIGPDLTRLGDKSADALIVAIFDPNRVVLDRYGQYLVTLRDGRALLGRVEDESTTSFVLCTLDGVRHTILRADLAELQATGVSLMPEGLEQSLTVEDVADLVAFLQGRSSPRKVLPGNEPVIVTPDADGVLVLPASSCEVYGDTIQFEPQFQNLGYWHSERDRAVWTVETSAAGTFDVVLDWACADAAAGDAFLLEGGAAPARGTIAATGGWDRYQQARIGRITVGSGRSRLTFRSDGPVHGALLDLRALRLEPVGR